jgi:dGTPase
MTHSLKVAQVGRRLVQYLLNDRRNDRGLQVAGEINQDVVTAAGLLHDVGHPPFGHIGEQQLNQWAKDRGLVDGYEGNAQTLRIILSLTVHLSHEELVDGLDLTRAVVAACVKYPWSSAEAEKRQKTKWGYYHTEAGIFENFVIPLLPEPNTLTLEAEIMDWADDITYAVHDLQDFYTDGIIPLHDLCHRPIFQNNRVLNNNYEPINPREFDNFWPYAATKLNGIIDLPSPVARSEFQKYATLFPLGSYRGERGEDAQLEALASRIITDASKATTITADGRLHIDKKMKAVVNVLKQITWYYVIDHPDLHATQIGQRARITKMCQELFKWVKSCFKQHENGRMLTVDEQWTQQRSLPVRLREFTEQLLAANSGHGAYEDRNHCYARAVLDYIASMTEVDFDRLWQRMCLS